jgi:lysophospholipase L1-like esterase
MSRVEFAYLLQPHGGAFDVFIDGARVGKVETNAAQAASGFTAFDTTDAPHRIEVKTVDDGAVRIFGLALDRTQPGVVVDTFGINGAQIFTPLRWNEAHFAEQLRHRSPDLVILAYGTNEALEPGLKDADYERKVVEMLGRIARAVPFASCLLLGPPDLARKPKGATEWTTWPRILEIAALQQRIAQAGGCAFYDQLAAMGGAGSITAWAAEQDPRASWDHVHLKRSGYAQLANGLAADILHAYDSWRSSRQLTADR